MSCYSHKGLGAQMNSSGIPCGPGPGTQNCCNEGDLCMSDNLCYSPSPEYGRGIVTIPQSQDLYQFSYNWYVAGCTDPTYRAPQCSDNCDKFLGLIKPCGGNRWSCGCHPAEYCTCEVYTDGPNVTMTPPSQLSIIALISSGEAIPWSIASASFYASIYLASATVHTLLPVTSSAPSTSSSSSSRILTTSVSSTAVISTQPATSNSHCFNKAMSIGIGVGVSLGVSLILAAAGFFAFRYRRRRHRKRTVSPREAIIDDNNVAPEVPTAAAARAAPIIASSSAETRASPGEVEPEEILPVPLSPAVTQEHERTGTNGSSENMVSPKLQPPLCELSADPIADAAQAYTETTTKSGKSSPQPRLNMIGSRVDLPVPS